MATDDFEEDRYDDDDGSVVDNVKELRQSSKDFKKTLDEYKSTREFNSQLRNKSAAQGAKETGKQAGKEAGKQASKEAGKQASKEAGKQASKEVGKQAAKEAGKQAGKQAAGTAAKAGASTAAKVGAGAASSTGYGAIIVAAIAVINALRKLIKKIDKKAAEAGVDTKGIKRLLALSPFALIILIVAAVIILILLLSQMQTMDRTNLLNQAIKCAESSGCSDFMGTKVGITSASVAFGGPNDPVAKIVAFTGEALSAGEQILNSNIMTAVSDGFEDIFSKKLIFFTDYQIARLVIEYLMFEHAYHGVAGNLINTINQFANSLTTEESNTANINGLFQMLVDRSIIGNIYEAYSLFNWLKLEKIAFNNIEWHMFYTGISGTGVSFIDDLGNNLCSDTAEFWRSGNLKKFCEEEANKTTESYTFKVPGDLNPMTSLLLVPTDIWSLGEATLNSTATAFGVSSDDINKFKSWIGWNQDSLPSQEILVNAVYDYLPKWTEIYSVYVNSGDLILANKIYNYYLANTKPDGEFGIKVSLYCLRNYEITRTTDLGDKKISYSIYKDEELLESGLSEGEMEKFLQDGRVDDEGNTIFDHIAQFFENLWNVIKKFWAGIQSQLATLWYKAETLITDFIYTKFPLTLASERHWTISVTKGTTFDEKHTWEYEVVTDKKVESGVEGKASEQFVNDKDLKSNTELPIKNNTTSVKDDGKVVSKTKIAEEEVDGEKVKVYQITEFVNIVKEITTWNERLNMISSSTEKYIITQTITNESGEEVTKDVEYDNRLAYAIEKAGNYNSDEYGAAYDAVRSLNQASYTFSGSLTSYSNLGEGIFGWPMEKIDGPWLSSCTGLRSGVAGYQGTETHTGDDLPAVEGTKILAAKEGKIIHNQYDPGGYGYFVVIQHENGWYTLYGHMVNQSQLAIGTEVKAGQVIGYVGTTGRSTGNHLHFEIRQGTSASFWLAEHKEPLFYISKETIPEDLTAGAENCPDKAYWGI